MHRIALLVLIAGPAMAGNFDSAVPDLSAITCAFPAVTSPTIPATSVHLVQDSNDLSGYIWVENGFPPLPVLAIFRLPDAPDALTSFTSVDLGGQFGMITYDPSGTAVLTRHKIDPAGGIAWTVQYGTCTEKMGT